MSHSQHCDSVVQKGWFANLKVSVTEMAHIIKL